MDRFLNLAHSKRERIAVIGDGSLAFVVANIINYTLPEGRDCGYWSSLGKVGTLLFCQGMLYY